MVLTAADTADPRGHRRDRARVTTRVWLEGGQAWRQGNRLTAMLWVVSLAAHLGYDYLVDGNGSQAGLGSASLLLYLSVTLVIQSLILNARAQRIDEGSASTRNTGAPAAF
jgi:hypothetical protein